MKTLALSLAAVAFVSGCATVKPRPDAEGRMLVHVNYVKYYMTSNHDMGAFIPWLSVPAKAIGALVAGKHALSHLGAALEDQSRLKVEIHYRDHEGPAPIYRPAEMIYRPVWDNLPEIVVGQWYVLETDDQGHYLSACATPCKPL